MKTPPPPARPPPAPNNHPAKDSGSGRKMTSERIAADLAAFQKAGGHIQTLGTTRWTDGKKSTAELGTVTADMAETTDDASTD